MNKIITPENMINTSYSQATITSNTTSKQRAGSIQTIKGYKEIPSPISNHLAATLTIATLL